MTQAHTFDNCVNYDSPDCPHHTDPAMAMLSMNFDKVMRLPEKLQGHVFALCNNCTAYPNDVA